MIQTIINCLSTLSQANRANVLSTLNKGFYFFILRPSTIAKTLSEPSLAHTGTSLLPNITNLGDETRSYI